MLRSRRRYGRGRITKEKNNNAETTERKAKEANEKGWSKMRPMTDHPARYARFLRLSYPSIQRQSAGLTSAWQKPAQLPRSNSYASDILQNARFLCVRRKRNAGDNACLPLIKCDNFSHQRLSATRVKKTSLPRK